MKKYWVVLILMALGFSLYAQNEPNVLLIMTDTQRKDDMGAYGNAAIKTPHLDQLANEGVMFQNCHVQYAACMPARAVIFTGRYPMANGVWSNGVNLPDDEVTIADVFLENGYRTGGAGKFHFMSHFPYRNGSLPTMATHPDPFYGFQEFHLGEDGGSGEYWQWLAQNHPGYANSPDHELPIELHTSFWTASHTINFIKKCATRNEPFFAFCSFVDPHQGYNPPEPYRSMYKEDDMPLPVRKENELENSPHRRIAESDRIKRWNNRTLYERTQHYGEMTFIDDMVGRIVAELERLKIADNTIIVFVSDHGDMLGDHWMWWKGNFHWPGCTNVPLFFNWPGKLKEGKSIDGMVQHTDVMPTILEMTGLKQPPGIQGKSLINLLITDESETGHEFAYTEAITTGDYHPEYFGGGYKKGERTRDESGTNTYTIRSLDWRITYYSGANTGELYNLKNDPDEFSNLWDNPAYLAKRTELFELLLNRVANTRDPLPPRIRPY
jgi:arylsulfatase A-like enzyme